VNVLGHDHIGVDAKLESVAHALQRKFEGSFDGIGVEKRQAMITGECNEMGLPGMLKSLESPWHEVRLGVGESPTQAKRRLEWGTVES